MNKIFIILSLSVLWACSNQKEVSIVDSFKTTQPLVHKVLEIENVANELLDPYSLAVSGNIINVCNPRSPKIFATIDIAKKRVIKHWGTMGQGPNEFMGLIDMYNNYSETGLNIWHGWTQELYFFSQSNLESDSTYYQIIPTGLSKTNAEIPKKSEFAYTLVQLDTLLFFTTGGSNNTLFTLFDLKNNESKGVGAFPAKDDINSQMPAWQRKIAYNGRIRYNSSLKKLIYMAWDCEMFEIYNVNGTNVELAMGNYTTIPRYRNDSKNSGGTDIFVEFLGNGKGRNRRLAISDENIFILYQDYEKAGIFKPTDYNNRANMVLVFDWDGNPVKLYMLDCFVEWVDYDKSTNRLYAVSNNPYPAIVYFEL